MIRLIPAPAPIQLTVGPESGRGLRLMLPADPENVAVVRQALTGLAEALAVDPAVLADMKTAVSEACNNVVVHAYGDGDGAIEVEARATADELEVTVQDTGRGITRAEAARETGGDGVGLSLIEALSDHVDITGVDGAGTVVIMRFAVAPALLDAADADDLLSAALGRVVAMLAARADFSLDRLSDAQLVADAISAHAPRHAADGALRVAVGEDPQRLLLRVGPLAPAGGEQVVADSDLPGVGQVLAQLADDVSVERPDGGAGELLVLRLTDGGS